MVNRFRSGGERWQNRAWLAVMLLLGAICPGLVHAQFERVWQIRTNLAFNGQFHENNYYAPAFSNNYRTITLYRLSSEGVLTPLWSYTEPIGDVLSSHQLAVDSVAERIFLRAMLSRRADLWALSMEGGFHWVTHTARPPFSIFYPLWLRGDGAGGVIECLLHYRDWSEVLYWYASDSTLTWSHNLPSGSVVSMDPLNRLLITKPILSNNRTVGIRYEWYTAYGNLVRAVEWRPSNAIIYSLGDLVFDATGNIFHSIDGSFPQTARIVLALSSDGQVRWQRSVRWGRMYYSPGDYSLLLLYLDSRQIGLTKLSAHTGEIIRSRLVYQTEYEAIDSVLLALDNRFLYVATNEGHIETECDDEGCDDYFVLDEVRLLRFSLDGELLAQMSLPESGYIYRVTSVQGNLWLFHNTPGSGGTISYYKPLAVHADGDIDGNGCVDDADLLRVLFAFGQTGTGLSEDINQDGAVDDADLLRVLFAFGFGC